MRPIHKLRIGLVLLLLHPFPVLAKSSIVTELQPVGQATLKVFFWTIYDSALYSSDGEFRGVQPGLALELDYRRNITKERLIETTREEWQDLDLYSEASEPWLQQLSGIWPDVSKGDVIVLKVDEALHGNFYFNDRFIGAIEDAAFTRDFLAIWTAENSRFPELRDKLVGADAD